MINTYLVWSAVTHVRLEIVVICFCVLVLRKEKYENKYLDDWNEKQNVTRTERWRRVHIALPMTRRREGNPHAVSWVCGVRDFERRNSRVHLIVPRLFFDSGDGGSYERGDPLKSAEERIRDVHYFHIFQKKKKSR